MKRASLVISVAIVAFGFVAQAASATSDCKEPTRFIELERMPGETATLVYKSKSQKFAVTWKCLKDSTSAATLRKQLETLGATHVLRATAPEVIEFTLDLGEVKSVGFLVKRSKESADLYEVHFKASETPSELGAFRKALLAN